MGGWDGGEGRGGEEDGGGGWGEGYDGMDGVMAAELGEAGVDTGLRRAMALDAGALHGIGGCFMGQDLFDMIMQIYEL